MIKHKLTFFVCLAAGTLFAQLPPGEYTTTNKEALSYLEAGKKAIDIKKYEFAEKDFKKALEKESDFIEAKIALGGLYQLMNRHKDAIAYFKKAVTQERKFSADVFYLVSLSEFAEGDYDAARVDLEEFLRFPKVNPTYKTKAEKYLINATFGATAVKSPKPYTPVNMGGEINTAMNESSPNAAGDGNQLLFTRGLADARRPGHDNEEVFMSIRQNNTWQTAQPVWEINSIGSEKAPSLSADGNMLFFVSCADESGDYEATGRKGFGSCDIFYSQKENGKWTQPKNAGPAVNTNNFETQPSFSSDGKTLYFIRGSVNKSRGKDQDIYMATLNDDGTFGKAVKVSSNINTAGEEESVFIHPDNQTLYFASDGHPGLGGLDLFMSKRQADGEWGAPVNLGYPINTFNDESNLTVQPNGRTAFFASNKSGGTGGMDIYQFELPGDMVPYSISYLKGKIYDAKSKGPLEANFELIDEGSQKQVGRSRSQKTGEFFITLTANNNYFVNVNKEGYLFYSDNFLLKNRPGDFNKPYTLDVYLQPIEVGSVTELKNVFFDASKADLKPESNAELGTLISFLEKNPTVKIEVGNHNYLSGDKKLNMTLSTQRAQAISDYLINVGKINAFQIKYQGYGDTKPKVANDSGGNMSKNSRTEVKIIGK